MYLHLTDDEYRRLQAHHFEGESERVSFLFCRWDGSYLDAQEIDLVALDSHEIKSRYHLELKDEVRGRVIRRATELDACLVEAHSHRTSSLAAMSFTDWEGLNELVPHVLWRLPRRPYGALVFAETSFDGLAWQSPAGPEPLGLVIGNNAPCAPTGLSLKRRPQ